ncbi:MAG: ChbG/HpnK family deacetylase [Rhodomicrobium sp.]
MQDLIINADDYAMDAGVDAAILKLAETGAVTAASAMVLSPRWAEAACAARDAPPISFGLHFDLTSPFAGATSPAQGVSALIVRAQAGLLDRAQLRRQADRQLQAFEKAFGGPPAFADGHQHIHHLPAVREVLLEALEDHYGREKERIGLRICIARRWRGLKAAIIARTGANSFWRLALERGHPINSDFAGVYDFDANAGLPALWQAWAANLHGPCPLIMCHVAVNNGESADGDPIRPARFSEFAWLASEQFQQFCQRSALNPVRWPLA